MKLNDPPIGRKLWSFAAGHIPLVSNGIEPEFTSHDKIAILNASTAEANIRIAIYFENDVPLKEYDVKVPARRVRKIRFNDLIDPLPISLDKPFGFTLTSSVEVVVQFSRMVTASKFVSGFCTTAFSQQNYE